MTLEELQTILSEYWEPGIRLIAEPYTMTDDEAYCYRKNRSKAKRGDSRIRAVWHVDIYTPDEKHIQTLTITPDHAPAAIRYMVTCAVVTIREAHRAASVPPWMVH